MFTSLKDRNTCMFDTWVVGYLILSRTALFSKPHSPKFHYTTTKLLSKFSLRCKETTQVQALRSFTLVKV